MLGYDDLTQGTAAGDYTKGGYGGSSQAPNKSAGPGPGKGSVSPSPGLEPGMTVPSDCEAGLPGVSGTGLMPGEQLFLLVGVSVSSGTTGLPDMTASVYNKTQVRRVDRGGQVEGGAVQSALLMVTFVLQTFDKQGFHAGTPPPFSLPSALGSTGPLAPGAAPGYAPAPFLHIMPAHQQPHSQLLHHHLPQDTPVSAVMEAASLPWAWGSVPAFIAFSPLPPQSGSGQRSQPSSLQPKSQASKPTYGNSPYWTN